MRDLNTPNNSKIEKEFPFEHHKTCEYAEQAIAENLKRFPGITQDQATGREEVTIDGKTGFLNGDGKLGTIDGDGKFVTYERLDKITKDNLKRYPNITQDQAAGREEITINGKTGFLNGDGGII